MKNILCKNCGGSMILDASATTAVCKYCGSTYVLNHEDTDYYKQFYKRMRSFFTLSKDEQERRLKADELWETAEDKKFECLDGKDIEVRYLYSHKDPAADSYTARRNIIYHFEEKNADCVEKFRKAISMLDYPSADTKSLSDFFPHINGGFELEGNERLLVITKGEDEYPLRLFGTLSGRHVAWIISRLENLCCVLEYNGLAHADLNIDSIYINPYDHTAFLYGNWWNAGKHNTHTRGIFLDVADNLVNLRKIAKELLGFKADEKVIPDGDNIPQALADFINGSPKVNAYEDFAYWDEMLIKAFGERKFINMDTEDGEIYK